MPIAKCGIQFSWDANIWCDPNGREGCEKCPLNKKYNIQRATSGNKRDLIYEEDYDYRRPRKF